MKTGTSSLESSSSRMRFLLGNIITPLTRELRVFLTISAPNFVSQPMANSWLFTTTNLIPWKKKNLRITKTAVSANTTFHSMFQIKTLKKQTGKHIRRRTSHLWEKSLKNFLRAALIKVLRIPRKPKRGWRRRKEKTILSIKEEKVMLLAI